MKNSNKKPVSLLDRVSKCSKH